MQSHYETKFGNSREKKPKFVLGESSTTIVWEQFIKKKKLSEFPERKLYVNTLFERGVKTTHNWERKFVFLEPLQLPMNLPIKS